MKAKLTLAGLLAMLALACLPGTSSAGWCTALTAGLRPPPEALDASEAPKADKARGEAVFQLACRSCRRGYSNYYSGYGAYYSGYSSYYYPSYSYYAGYGSYYPSSSYYLSASYYPAGCGGWSPCGCAPSCCDSGW